MGTLFKHFLLFRIVHINLRTFQNLQRDSAVTVVCQERTSTWFAYVLHHTADAHRTVQFFFQVYHQFGIFQILRLRVLAIELLLQELQDFKNLFVCIFPAFKQLQIGKYLLLQSYQYTGNQLFI